MYTITLDTSALEAACKGAIQKIPATIDDALEECMRECAARIRQTGLFKDRSGQLRASVFGTKTGSFAQGNLIGEVHATAPYASFINDGTPPHVIEAKGKVLRFESGGKVAFARRVNHPGIRARKFMETEALTPGDCAARIEKRVTSKLRELGW